MRSGFLRTILVVLVLVAIPAMVQARSVHFFPCEDCHKAGVSPTTVTNNVCLDCHETTSADVTLNDSSVVPAPGRFSVGDASNAFGNNPAAAKQTSHNWGASDVNPGAGAKAPSDRFFYGRNSYSAGSVACSRCHDPHGDDTVNPKLYKLPPNRVNPVTGVNYVVEDMCLDCHIDWNVDNNQGQETHPLVQDYATRVNAINSAWLAANPSKTIADAPYKPVPDNSVALGPNGDVKLMNGNISCSSCHGLHGADSDSTTVDGLAGAVNSGDGKILRSDGRNVEDMALCVTCHNYKLHGASANAPGCLDCHSGHSYNDGSVNFYVLRGSIDNVYVPKNAAVGNVAGLEYSTNTSDWMNIGGTGYCQNCHNLGASHNGYSSGNASTNCDGCHSHDEVSFTGGACNACHGYAPDQDVAGGPRGYASDGTAQYIGGVQAGVNPKDESLTAHIEHSDLLSVGAGNHQFSCNECHANFNTTHKNGVFEDVVFGPLAQTGGMVPAAYDPGTLPTDDGTCATVYCHSNGGKRTGDGPTRSYNAASIPTWENGNIPGCSSCHGNSVATMAAGQRDNSPSHDAHLNMGYTCNVCHSSTAVNNGTLTAAAVAGGSHVNASVDVTFDDTYNLGSGTLGAGGSYAGNAGTCATVYCHSDGGGNFAAPDWDSAASGNCGTCHDVTGEFLPDAHNKHVFDADGPGLACNTCHTHNGGSAADHVNGAFDTVANLQTNVCDSCHGVDSVDNVEPAPVWSNAASMDCQTCHVDTLSSMAGVIDKSTAEDGGHNRPVASGAYAVTSNTPAALNCEACHDRNATGHLDAPGDKRLLTGFDCMTCHDGSTATLVDTHTNIGATIKTEADFTLACLDCHDPHGHVSNAGMVDVTNVVFTARTGANSFDEADAANADDICATCHTNTSHNNTAATGTHNEGADCMPCHSHGDAFMPSGGSSCEDCHSAKLAEGRHAAHTDNTPDVETDVSECAICHPSVAAYTITGGSPDHFSNSASDFASGITNPQGATTTCSSAMGCHTSTAGDGSWQDVNGLNCDACHGNAPANGGGDGTAHADHVAQAGIDCDTCHGVVPTDTAHITDFGGPDNHGVQLTDRANATADEANVTETSFNPIDNTCNNTACHNPSGGPTYAASWDTSISSCALCHSATDPGTGSHTEHMTAATNFGITPACTDCHGDTTTGGTDMRHRSTTVEFAAGFTYSGDATDFTNTTWGTCTTTTCHNDGQTPANAVVSPTWGTPSADCTICHTAPPTTGDHANHWAAARTGNGLGCLSCHSGTASDNTTADGANHIDTGSFDVAAGGNYSATPVTISYTQGAPSTCTANCHTDAGRTFNWEVPNSCNACHDAGGPTDNIHSTHTTVTLLTTAEDRTDCAQCHPGANTYAYDLSHANHGDGSTTLAAGISSLGGGDYSCNICHLSSAGDGNFLDADGLNCDACHYYSASPTLAANDSHGSPLSAGLDPSHSAHFNKSKVCSDCHTVPVSGTSHITDTSGTSEGAVLQGMAQALPDEAAVTRASMTFTDGTNTCSGGGIALGCHATGSPVWNTTISTCTACHTDETTASVNPTSGLHDAGTATRHDDSLAGGNCVNCHDANSPSSAHQDGTLQDSTGATFTFHSNVDGYSNANGCASAACHSDGGDWNRKWINASDAVPAESDAENAAVCDNCHGSFTSGWRFVNEGNATSTDHTDPSALNGTDEMDTAQHLDCTRCHGWGTAGATGHHQDGFIGMNSDLSYNNTTGTCGINCHGGQGFVMNTDSGWSNHNIAGGALNCGACHADGTLPPTSGSHAAHGVDADTDYTECESCHGTDNGGSWASGLGLHNNGSVDFATGVNYSGGAAGTCSTSACHSTATNTSTWGTPGSVGCDECHYYEASPSSANNTAHADSLSGTHGAHFDKGKVCTECHADNSGDTTAARTHITSGTGTDGVVLTNRANALQNEAAVARANMTWTDAGNTCSGTGIALGCHATGTPDWDDATTADNCTDCHTDTSTGSVNPTSGLHAVSNITTHDNTLAGGCEGCHDATSPSSLHQNSTLNDASQGSWTFNSGNSVVYDQANGCNASCHSDGGDWQRKWTGVTDLVPTGAPGAAVCDNCHGDFTNGWRDVNANHTNPYTGNASDAMDQHGVCETCHGWGNANYDTAWGAPSANNGHGDGSITMNGPNSPLAGAGYNENSWGCAAACHTELPFVMNDSAWPVNYGNFGSGDCIGCHTANGVRHGDTAESLALHNAHNANLYIDTEGDWNASSAATFNNCDTCHGHNGTGGHWSDTTVTFDGTNISTGSNYARGAYPDTGCTNACHTAESGEWNAESLAGGSTGDCVSCHGFGSGILDQGGYLPTSNRHGEHLGNSNYVTGCADCHTHSGSVAAVDHVNTTVETGGAITVLALPDCTNNCHGTTGDGWDSTKTANLDLNCDDCHGAAVSAKTLYRDRTSGSHGSHVDTGTEPTTYGSATNASSGTTYDFGCGQCHPTAGGSHLNGSTNNGEIQGGINYSGGTTGTCSSNACHNNGLGGAPNTAPTWGTAFTGDSCTKCHSNAPGTGAHSAHAVGIHAEDIYTGTSGEVAASGTLPSAHGNGTTSTVLSCNTCHNSSINVWHNALNTTCAACHDTSNTSLGDNAAYITETANHVNGAVEVQFQNIAFRSKAQARDDITTIGELNANWTRTNGYKNNNSYDLGKTNLSSDSYADSTCTNTCHNGNDATWVAPTGNCMACHTELPQ